MKYMKPRVLDLLTGKCPLCGVVVEVKGFKEHCKEVADSSLTNQQKKKYKEKFNA